MAASPITGTKRMLSTPEVSPQDRTANAYSTSGLCTRCLELPLEKGLDAPLDGFEIKIADVGTYYRQPAVPSCNLCRLLCDSRMTAGDLSCFSEISLDSDELRAFDVAYHSLWAHQNGEPKERERLFIGYDLRYLAVVPSGTDVHRPEINRRFMGDWGNKQGFLIFHRHGSRQPDIFAPRIVGPKFDFSLGKAWLRYCESHHMNSCSRIKRPTKGLRLINCHSFVVEPASSQQEYVALSYVWGPPSAGNSETETESPDYLDYAPFLTDPPAVISDAMKVTLEMGFDYLWVDKFCIDQKDKAAKHGQISQMDSIYHNAELTIIAAAGSDETYGLPGMSSRVREPYPTITVRDINIISTLRHPHSSIPSSKWATRGWTLQEAVLSRRRLVFTDDQVYFECAAMNCNESLASSLDKLHVHHGSKFRHILLGGIFGHDLKYGHHYGHFDEKNISPVQNFARFGSIVAQYCRRDLTYDSDTLEAMSGIFRRFQDGKDHIAQIYGIPFFSGMPDKAMVSFLEALTWIHRWPNLNVPQPRRREGFPSWSWAGWGGSEVLMDTAIQGQRLSYESIEVSSVSIDIGSETIFDLSKYSQGVRAEDGLQLRLAYLQFRAPLFPSSLFSYDDSSEPPSLKMGQLNVKLYLSTGPGDPHNFIKSLEDGRRQCIYWGQCVASSDHLMVLQRESNGTWSRVGIIFVFEDPYEYSFHTQWSGVELGTPEYNFWLKERPTGYFRIR